jgi:hypothetical protein
MRALAYKVTGLLRSELNLGFLVFLYVARLDIQPVHLKTVRDIGAAQRQDNWLTFLKSDYVWVVGKSLGDNPWRSSQSGSGRAAPRGQGTPQLWNERRQDRASGPG